MEERELVALINQEVSLSIGGMMGDLATERQLELDAYNSQPYGNEKEGESQVVSSDVFDAVESMLPHLLKTFTASDDAVIFEPEGPEDEEQAKQKTDLCNYVFYRKNNGFLVMYEWFKDALIQKNGVVKYWWEEKKDVTNETYEGLTEGEYQTLLAEEGVSVVSESAYPDDVSAKQKALGLEQAMAQIDQQAARMPPEAVAELRTRVSSQFDSMPVPMLHDVEVTKTKDVSRVCIEAVPPEEFGISSRHKCISIQQTPFCYHETKKSYSDLRALGCPEDVLERAGTAEDRADLAPESMARNRFQDERVNNAPAIDESLKEVSVRDIFINVDDDDDGIAERRHVIQVGNAIWVNEPENHINFAAITPIIMPHRWVGKSWAEIVMDFQFLSTVLWRQMLNNLYLTNNPRKVVLSNQAGQTQANLDDLMTSRVGGVIREYVPNAVRNEEIPFVAGASFPMLEFMEGKKEQRTGNTRYNQGTDADSLNKTARGIQMIQSAAQQKLDLVARLFAETGVKDLFRGIAYLMSRHSSRKLALRLRGTWVDIDPREWSTQFDMRVNVGLGTGNKDAQLVHLVKMNEVQLKLMEMGRGYMVTDDNIYNLATKMAENMGFKHPELFVTDPKNVQKPPPQPNPDIIKIQAETQIDQAKIKKDYEIRQFDAQTQEKIETIKAQTAAAIAQMQEETKRAIEQLRIQNERELAVYDKESGVSDRIKSQTDATLERMKEDFAGWKAKLDASAKIAVAEIAARAGIDQAMISAANKAKADEASEDDGKEDDGKDVSALIESVKGETDAKLDQLVKIIGTIAVKQDESSRSAKAPRKHVFTKTPTGYEVTSTVH